MRSLTLCAGILGAAVLTLGMGVESLNATRVVPLHPLALQQVTGGQPLLCYSWAKDDCGVEALKCSDTGPCFEECGYWLCPAAYDETSPLTFNTAKSTWRGYFTTEPNGKSACARCSPCVCWFDPESPGGMGCAFDIFGWSDCHGYYDLFRPTGSDVCGFEIAGR